MFIKNSIDTQYKEYLVEFTPEEEEILLELGRKSIIEDKHECINYAVKILISRYMND
jgi:hypothetical protein